MGNLISMYKQVETKCEVRDCYANTINYYCYDHACPQNGRGCRKVKLAYDQLCEVCQCLPVCSTPGCSERYNTLYLDHTNKFCSLKHKCDYCDKCVYHVDATNCDEHKIKISTFNIQKNEKNN